MEWFRFYTRTLECRKVQALQPSTFRGWCNLLCLASVHCGILPDFAEIAFRLRCSERQAQDLVTALEDAKLVDRNEEGRFEMHDWNEHQYVSDDSTARVRKHRAKRKGNVSVTPPDTDTDTEQIQRQKTPPLPPLPTASEYPETAAAVREKDPACDDLFVRRLVATTVQAALSDPAVPDGEVDKITDAIMADAVRESFKTFNGRRQHGTGLLLSRVPQIVKNWCKEPDE